MGFTWTPQRERLLLLLTITRANLKPSTEIWPIVAALLDSNVSASAVRYGSSIAFQTNSDFRSRRLTSTSQKYYKLRNETLKHLDGEPIFNSITRPKRKAASIGVVDGTPRKRARKEVRPKVLKCDSLNYAPNDMDSKAEEFEMKQEGGDAKQLKITKTSAKQENVRMGNNAT
jgi:hypothetical protein